MPRFKSIIVYENSPKIKLFLQKNAKFRALVALPPDPQNSPFPLRISGYAPVCSNLVCRAEKSKNA